MKKRKHSGEQILGLTKLWKLEQHNCQHQSTAEAMLDCPTLTVQHVIFSINLILHRSSTETLPGYLIIDIHLAQARCTKPYFFHVANSNNNDSVTFKPMHKSVPSWRNQHVVSHFIKWMLRLTFQMQQCPLLPQVLLKRTLQVIWNLWPKTYSILLIQCSHHSICHAHIFIFLSLKIHLTPKRFNVHIYIFNMNNISVNQKLSFADIELLIPNK